MRLCKLLVLEKYQLDVALQESHELPLSVCSCCGISAVCVCVKPFQGPCNLDVVMCVRYLVQIWKALYIALFFVPKAGFASWARELGDMFREALVQRSESAHIFFYLSDFPTFRGRGNPNHIENGWPRHVVPEWQLRVVLVCIQLARHT